MQLSNLLLPLALFTRAAFAARSPNPSGTLVKRTDIFYFLANGTIGFGQPPNFSAARFPTFCYFPDKDIKIYWQNPLQKCGNIPVQMTDPSATVA